MTSYASYNPGADLEPMGLTRCRCGELVEGRHEDCPLVDPEDEGPPPNPFYTPLAWAALPPEVRQRLRPDPLDR